MVIATAKSIIVSVLLLVFALPVCADEAMKAEEIKSLLSGNTVEGQLTKWGISQTTYYESSGHFRRIDGNNNKGKGKWYVDKHDYLCHEGRRERCRIMKKRDDGGYNLYNKKEELLLEIGKVLPGNPHNL